MCSDIYLSVCLSIYLSSAIYLCLNVLMSPSIINTHKIIYLTNLYSTIIFQFVLCVFSSLNFKFCCYFSFVFLSNFFSPSHWQYSENQWSDFSLIPWMSLQHITVKTSWAFFYLFVCSWFCSSLMGCFFLPFMSTLFLPWLLHFCVHYYISCGF